ncbi:cytochrome C oxidase subunit III [Aromatoleum toluvorans]|uniref:Cytochrome C oxidase subunit III n=1 Tax=Aromatoleum toluvorans TaxID=92002 RepID=A0ABX1PUS5_9RHOO|nr:cytochrome c oxidase subunit 3 [Aromatoleum toluvorans]NMG43203.1 cytochrome C oxidase subunit III [Aromatoleum toluvorans]
MSARSGILAALATKPWLPQPLPPVAAPRLPAATVGLRVLLGVIGVLFGLFAIALLVRARLPDWQPLAGTPTSPLAGLGPLWTNTALLAASSLALQAASGAARRGRLAATRFGLVLAGAAALAFLAGQGWVWWLFIATGHFVASHPAASFFYLLTGVHGLHLAGGLVALGRSVARAWRERSCVRVHAGVARCALYWHFLFAVWLVLFALLASPPATLAALADICGIR